MPTFNVYYVVPEDGDTDEAHPNWVEVRGAGQQLKLGELRAAFPLPGTYHFRFKRAFRGSAVWLDVLDDDAPVPVFEGAIIAKVSRLSARSGAVPASAASRGAAAATATATATAAPKPASAAPVHHVSTSRTPPPPQASENALFGWDDEPASAPPVKPASAPVPTTAAAAAATAAPLVDFGSPSPQTGNGGGGDAFFDFLGGQTAAPAASTQQHSIDDLSWGTDPFAAPVQSQTQAQGAGGAPPKRTASGFPTELGPEAAKMFQL